MANTEKTLVRVVTLTPWTSSRPRGYLINFSKIRQTYPLGRPVQGKKKFFFFFALNWVFKLDHFCSNWITFRNGVWVRAEECARMNTNGPILWRIVCRGCGWSFFKFLSAFVYHFSAHSKSIGRIFVLSGWAPRLFLRHFF